MLRRKEEATGEEELDCRTEVDPQEGELEEWPAQTEEEIGERERVGKRGREKVLGEREKEREKVRRER